MSQLDRYRDLANPPPIPPSNLPRVRIADMLLARGILASLGSDLLPVFSRWPDPSGDAMIGSAANHDAAVGLVKGTGAALDGDLMQRQIAFELAVGSPTPIQLEATAWIPA